MNEEILVVPTCRLSFLGKEIFIRDGKFMSEILKYAEFKDRGIVEHNNEYKQLIPYALLKFNNKFFKYQRSFSTEEDRLRKQYSIGVGGHINKSDGLLLIENFDWAIERELSEEIDISIPKERNIIGYINDNSDSVGKVHFGIIYEFILDNEIIRIKEKSKLINFGFVSISELLINYNYYENWSRIIIKDYLK
jgi:predicted NUDIX family phosphoesterase